MDIDEVWDELHDLMSNMPLRCYTCGKVLARASIVIKYMFGVYTEKREPMDLFNELGLERLCCRNVVATLPTSQPLRTAMADLEPTDETLKLLMATGRGTPAPQAAAPAPTPGSKRVSTLGVAKRAPMSFQVGEPLTRAQAYPYSLYVPQYEADKPAYRAWQVATPEQERQTQAELRTFMTERDIRTAPRPKGTVLVSRAYAPGEQEEREKATLRAARLSNRAWELEMEGQQARRFGDTARADQVNAEREYTLAELETAMKAV